MTKHPYKNIAASVRQRLLNRARETGRPFSEVLQYFAMERFLYRLSKSPYADNFILKGALMLAVWEAPLSRATMDIDLLGRIDNNVEGIIDFTRAICRQKVNPDGISFDEKSIKGERITEDADYEGVRVRFQGSLGTAQITMQLDIGFGDVVVPQPELIDYPTILDLEAPQLLGYSIESTIAEKFEAMVKLGVLNSRMKDFFDIWLLLHQFDFSGPRLAKAISKTFSLRGTEITMEPIALTVLFAEDPTKNAQWRGFIRKSRLKNVPQEFDEVVFTIAAFLGPIAKSLVVGEPFNANWSTSGTWLE
ncbi:MAG: nucleotidyl transferase AbiEii/AbiGii toxin family protein [Thermodesulfobacteriota bacterium]